LFLHVPPTSLKIGRHTNTDKFPFTEDCEYYAITHHCPSFPFSENLYTPTRRDWKFYGVLPPVSTSTGREKTFQLVHPDCPIVGWSVKIAEQKNKRTSTTAKDWTLGPIPEKDSLNNIVPSVFIIPVNRIHSPTIAVKNPTPTFPYEYMFVDNPTKWAGVFKNNTGNFSERTR